MQYTLAFAGLLTALTPSVFAQHLIGPVPHVKHTFYGYSDNFSSNLTAYSCPGRGNVAGGDGSYKNPLTFAGAPNHPWDECEIAYDPYTAKYIIFQDVCEQCVTDYNNDHQKTIAIWLGPTNYDAGGLLSECEGELASKKGQTVIRDPHGTPKGKTAPLFKGETCYPNRVYPQ